MTDENALQVQVDQVSKQQWDELIHKFKDATVFQTWSYGAVRWGEHNLSHLVLQEGGEPVAAAQVRIIRPPVPNAGIAYVTYGPLWQRKNADVRSEIFRQALRALKDEYAGKRKLLLRLNLNLYDNIDKEIFAILTAEGFSANRYAPEHRTLVLDLSPPLDQIRASLKQKWRNILNKALRGADQLRMIEGTSPELLQKFIRVYREMHRHKKFVETVSPEEFAIIQQDLPAASRLRVMICEAEGVPIAGMVCSVVGEKAIYILGASNALGRKHNASYLLQWRMIEWMKDNGIRYYDLGGIDPEGNPGTYRFKVGLAGKNGLDVHYIGVYDYSGSFLSSVFGRMADLLRKYYLALKQFMSKLKR